jgi:hypothetical protein
VYMRRPTLSLSLLVALLVGCTLALPAASLASSYLTGFGDEQAAMFASPLYKQLGTRVARYIAPYDVVSRPADLQAFEQWYQGAQADGVQPLLAFYHSRYTPMTIPSSAVYKLDVARFIKMFPAIKSYQPWNEANRGEVPGLFKSPTATQSADFYVALKSVCPHCTVVGLDVLDGSNIKPTIVYIKQFQRALNAKHIALPTIWGLHDYSDTNRFRSSGTRAVLAAVKGQVWLTETGGIVQFGSSFKNIRGSGLARAAKALRYMFTLAASNPRIKRLYIFQWTGSSSHARVDAGLIGPEGEPRAGYVAVCQHLLGLHSAKCSPATLKVTPTQPTQPSSPVPYGTPVSLNILPPTFAGALDGAALLSP